MGEGDEWSNAGSEEVVAELGVVVNTGLVDWVVTATFRDDTSPRKGEAVGLRAERLEEGNILGGTVVRIAGSLTRTSISNLARDLGEGIPDTGATAILVDGTLDLVTEGFIISTKPVGNAISSRGFSYEAVAKPQTKSLGRAAILISVVSLLGQLTTR